MHRLRDEVLAEGEAALGTNIDVTGQLPATVDFSGYMSERMPYFFAAVLVLSFLLLMVVFRSVLVPLKAVIMNLLSIGAAYGVTVALVQWAWLGDFTGLSPSPIETFIPMMFFAIVFGLSMDYEVFLLSRVKEEWTRTGDSHLSVANGLATTARVITAAAAIMVVVFGSFILENDRNFKMFGIGLATAIFLDATVVRMLLVPATMELLGDKNWWLPRWLDRILPHVNIEGTPDDVSEIDERPDADPEPERELVTVSERCTPAGAEAAAPHGPAALNLDHPMRGSPMGDRGQSSAARLADAGVRALVDGTVATVLPAYLIARGLGPTEVGAVVTATLLGSAVVTLLLGPAAVATSTASGSCGSWRWSWWRPAWPSVSPRRSRCSSWSRRSAPSTRRAAT